MTPWRVIFILHIASVTTNELCDLSEWCIGRTLNGSGETEIEGYNAASGTNTSFSGGFIDCRAAYSCHSMSFMHAKSGTVSCSADNACSDTIIQSNTSIECTGAHSCMNSIMSAPLTVCSGSRSCERTNITGVASISSNGILALYKATIDTISSAVSVIDIYLRSHLSAFGASLICRPSHECNIECQTTDACYMFYIDCIGTCNIKRTASYYHNPINDLNQFVSMNYDDLTVYQPFDYNMISLEKDANALCTTAQWAFDDAFEQSHGPNIVVTIANDGPVCCRGYGACQYVGVIEYKTQIKKDLICSAGHACRWVTIQNIDDTLFCQGRGSCRGSVIDYVPNVYCSSYGACTHAVITGATNILCHGVLGCYTATVISGGYDVNIFAFAYRGAEHMNIYCNRTETCVLHCLGSQSCEQTVLFCDGNCTVHCVGDVHCPTYFNRSTIQTTRDPLFNVSFEPVSDVTTTINLLSTFYTTIHAYTSSIQIEETSKKSSDTAVIMAVIIAASVVNVLAFYYVRRYYLKQKKVKQQAQQLSVAVA
eukprot:464125_1